MCCSHKHVDEIEPRVNFTTFYELILHAKILKVQKDTYDFNSLFVLLGYEVDFTNMFMHSFYSRRSPKRKIQSSLQCLFTLLESFCLKAACKMWMKLTAGFVKAGCKHVDEIDQRVRRRACPRPAPTPSAPAAPTSAESA